MFDFYINYYYDSDYEAASKVNTALENNGFRNYLIPLSPSTEHEGSVSFNDRLNAIKNAKALVLLSREQGRIVYKSEHINRIKNESDSPSKEDILFAEENDIEIEILEINNDGFCSDIMSITNKYYGLVNTMRIRNPHLRNAN